MEINFNDRRNSYGQKHKNIIEIKEKDVVEFKGKSIPGVVQVLSKDFCKDGNWSYSTWKCDLEDGCKAIVWHKDFKTNKWLLSKTWLVAIVELQMLGFSASTKLIIRKIFPGIAKSFDKKDAQYSSSTKEAENILRVLKNKLI